MSGIDDIAAERKAHLEREGWTPEHDDEHSDGSLAMAAALYASPRDDLRVAEFHANGITLTDPWPWHRVVDVETRGGDPIWGRLPAWDKRQKHDRRRRLVIAGALIAAEIDRLDRESAHKAAV